MIDPNSGVPDVEPDEMLARFILQSSHIRPSDQTVKPNAFIPHPWPELSVTRHLSATENEVWGVGEDVANSTAKTLYGRADFRALTCIAQQLSVVAADIPGNPNHANICNWPADKPAQKIIAQELAAAAVFVPKR